MWMVWSNANGNVAVDGRRMEMVVMMDNERVAYSPPGTSMSAF